MLNLVGRRHHCALRNCVHCVRTGSSKSSCLQMRDALKGSCCQCIPSPRWAAPGVLIEGSKFTAVVEM